MNILDKQKTITQFFKSTTKKTSAQEPNKPEKTIIEQVPGVILITNFITESEETFLWNETNKMPWEPLGDRFQMKLGWRHDPEDREKMVYVGELPDPYRFVTDRILEEGLMKERPEQCVVNYYHAGQGVYPHIDRVEDYGSEIAGVSLGSDVAMEFHGPKNERIEIFLPRRSLYFVEGVARYDWKHTIPARNRDRLKNGLVNIRRKRISLTFRHVKIGYRREKNDVGIGK
jgi:alkylated DNA repair dioxygenase AlkB